MADGQWYNSYIMGGSGDLYFFMIIEKGISAVYHKRHGEKEMGAFYRVKIVKNPTATEKMRAQHLVSQIEDIAPLAERRIEYDKNNKCHVHITTIAKVDGFVNHNGKQVPRLSNDTFGTFIDIDQLVYNDDAWVKFEFKCKASPRNPYLSLFTPTKVLEYCDPPRRLKEVDGFVISSPGSHEHRIWSRDLTSIARIDPRICSKEPSGLWIRVAVKEDDEDNVVKVIKYLPDVFYSRLENGIPEILVDFCYDGYDRPTKSHVYRHHYFDLILDMNGKIKDPRNGEKYEGWIAHAKTGIPNCSWKISGSQLACRFMGNDEVSPPRQQFRDRSRYTPSPTSSFEADDVPPSNLTRERTNLPPQVHRNQHLNEPLNNKSPQPSSRPVSRRSSSSSAPSRAPTTDSEDDEEITKRLNSLKKETSFDKYDHINSSANSSSRGFDRGDSRSESREESLFSQDGFSDDDVAPAARRDVQTSHPLVDHSDSDSEKEQKRAILLSPGESSNGPSSSLTTESGSVNEQPNARVKPKNVLDPMNRKVRLLENTLDRLKLFISDFADQPDIERAMKLHNLEQYEDMMSLVERKMD